MTEQREPRPIGQYTKEQRAATLKGLSIVREAHAGGDRYAAEDAMREVAELVADSGEPVDSALAHLVSGLANVAGVLLDWIENEADNKRILLADVRRKLSDYEEPDDYRTDPKWSDWDGVLRAIEKTVRESPTAD